MALFPLGHCSGLLVKSTLKDVARWLTSWGNEYPVNRGTISERDRMCLEDAWKHVDTRQFQPNRAFIVPVGRQWTGFFDNHSDEFLAQADATPGRASNREQDVQTKERDAGHVPELATKWARRGFFGDRF